MPQGSLAGQLFQANLMKGRALGQLEVADREEKRASRIEQHKIEGQKLKLEEKEGELKRRNALQLRDKMDQASMQQQLVQTQGALQQSLVAAASRGAIVSEEDKPGYTSGIPTEVGVVRAPFEEETKEGGAWKFLHEVKRGDKATGIFLTPDGKIQEKDYDIKESVSERTKRGASERAGMVSAAKGVLGSLKDRFKEGELNPMLQMIAAMESAKSPGESKFLLESMGQVAPPDFVAKMGPKERNLWNKTVRRLEQLAGMTTERSWTESQLGLRKEEPFSKIQAEITAGRGLAEEAERKKGMMGKPPQAVQSRFETEQANNLLPKGTTLGKLTPKGWEVKQDGKTVGYFD